jgi:hypothetical protein
MRRAQAALDKVGLLAREKARPIALSGGEQQRLAIARAVVNRPAVLLADEPTGNLDSESAREILEIFAAFHQVGVTVVVATHDQQLDRALSPERAAPRSREAGDERLVSQHRAALAAPFRRLWSTPLNTLLSLLVIGIALTLPGASATCCSTTCAISAATPSGVQQISLFMNLDAEQEGCRRDRKWLRRRPRQVAFRAEAKRR